MTVGVSEKKSNSSATPIQSSERALSYRVPSEYVIAIVLVEAELRTKPSVVWL